MLEFITLESKNGTASEGTILEKRRGLDLHRVTICLGCFCALVGCVSTATNTHPDARPRMEVFGLSVEGRPIKGYVIGDGPEHLFLFGVIHGNETGGKPLLEKFIEHVEVHPEFLDGKMLVIVPVANPDGFARKSRRNSRGVDLNRNFPARNWKRGRGRGPAPASEPETRALLKIIRQFQPQRILAIHAPLRMVNYDGPAESLASELSEACGYPVESSVGYPTPGSLGSYAGIDWNTPTITLELGKDVRSSNVWSRFAATIEAFVNFRGRHLASPRGRRTNPISPLKNSFRSERAASGPAHRR